MNPESEMRLNLWRVRGAQGEHPHAQKLCRVEGYELDAEGRDLCRVRFVYKRDIFEPEEAVLPPHLLLPEQGPPSRRPHFL